MLLKHTRGFTLRELLVVVLIIAVLAAVALPQYNKAVIKSRIFAYFPVAKSIVAAQRAYFLANGEYADSFDKLDVTLPPECLKQNGAYENMRYCNDSIVLDISKGSDGPTGKLILSYCSNKAHNYGNCFSHPGLIYFTFSFLNDKITCRTPDVENSISQKVCQEFNAH